MSFEKVISNAKADMGSYLDRMALEMEMEKVLGKMAEDVAALDTKLEEEKTERKKLQGELDVEKQRRTEIEQKLNGWVLACGLCVYFNSLMGLGSRRLPAIRPRWWDRLRTEVCRQVSLALLFILFFLSH
jgi:hypothetical protein